MGGPLALDGFHLMGGHNNQPNVVVDGEGGFGEETRPGDYEGEARQAGGAGEAQYHCFWEALG